MLYHPRLQLLIALLGLCHLPSLVLGFMTATRSFNNQPPPAGDHGVSARGTRRYGTTISELYSKEDPDPNRRKLKLVRLGAFHKKVKKSTGQELQLGEYVWGRWVLEEESIDRPSNDDLKKYGPKLKPTWSKYTEDLLFDQFGSLMLTDPNTAGFGCGWAWTGIGAKDTYEAPTLRFRINRKGVGIDFDEFDDINDQPSMFFYSGTFKDGDFNLIHGIVERNRDIVRPKDAKRVVVKVGTFTMRKVD